MEYERYLMGSLKGTLSMLQYEEQKQENYYKKARTEEERTLVKNKLKIIREEIEAINRSIKMKNGGRIR